MFQQLIKSFEVCDLPVRNAKFVARKNWVITGSVSIHTLFNNSEASVNLIKWKTVLPGPILNTEI